MESWHIPTSPITCATWAPRMAADASAACGTMHILPITWHENNAAITVAASRRGALLVVDCMRISIDDSLRIDKAAPPSPSTASRSRPVTKSPDIPEQQVPTGDDADEFPSADHGHAGQIAILKERGQLSQRSLFGHGQDRRRHDV